MHGGAGVDKVGLNMTGSALNMAGLRLGIAVLNVVAVNIE